MLKRKIIGISFALFLLVSTTGASAFNTVENSLTTTTNNTIYVPDDYPTIQAAIDAAVDGDTIIVKEERYPENIVINKKLSIYAYDQYTAVITGALNNDYDPIVEIKADDVYLCGFKILCGFNIEYHAYTQWGIHIKNSEDVTIAQNILTNGTKYGFEGGILVESSNNIEITDNEITNCDIGGIRFRTSSNYNIVTENYISDCEYGSMIIIGDKNTIESNEIKGGDFGVRLDASDENDILDNDIMFSIHAISIDKSNHNAIEYNKINPTDSSICLWESNYNTITNNTMADRRGIRLHDSNYNTIEGNKIEFCLYYSSITLDESNHNTVTDNRLIGKNSGIILYESNHNTVTDNRLIGESTVILERDNCEGNDIRDNKYITISKPLSRIVSLPFVERLMSNLKIQSLFSIFKQFLNKWS
jgi:parallel beta-helix repeat protein